MEMMKRFLGAPAASPPSSKDESDLKALRERVGELEARIKKTTRAKRRARRKH
jgi:hypothetical protein